MSDGVVIPLDVDDTRARSKVARLKRDAADAGREYGRAGSQAARIGGVGGGALGRSLGGFAQGAVAGGIGLGLTAIGLGINGYMARDRERVDAAVARETRQQGREAIQRTVMERTTQRAAGGVSFAGSMRRMISRGDNYIDTANTMRRGSEFGLTAEESLAAIDQEGKGNISSHQVMQGLATGMIGDTAEEVSTNIRKFNGVPNAIAAMQNMTPTEAVAALDRAVSDPRAQNIAAATSGMNRVKMSQMEDLLTGRTASAVQSAAEDEMDPGKKLLEQANQAAEDTKRQLLAAADAQGNLARILLDIGQTVGFSEGSARHKLVVGSSSNSETSGP